MPLFTTASQAFLETSWRAITSQVHLFRKSTRRCACSLPGYLRFQVAKRIARSRCRSSLLWVIPQSPSCFILSNKRSPVHRELHRLLYFLIPTVTAVTRDRIGPLSNHGDHGRCGHLGAAIDLIGASTATNEKPSGREASSR